MTRWMWMLVACAAAGLGGAAPAGAQAQPGQRIAFISMEKVFEEYYKTRQADAQLKEQAAEFNEERTGMVEDLRAREEAFTAAREEAQAESLSAEARERKRAEAEEMLADLREREKELRTFDEARRKELDEQGRRMRARIVDEINAVVRSHAEKNELFAVVDSSGASLNQVPVFVFASPSADITDEILEQLNATQGTEAPADE